MPITWKLVVLLTSLTGGAIGLFEPVGVVKRLLQTEARGGRKPDLFLIPVWYLLVLFGLLIGRRLGMLPIGGKRVLQR